MSAPPPSIRPLSRAQALENAAFLAELAKTGNPREAARRLGAHRAKFTRRRARHAGFAAQWDAALVLAQNRLAQGLGGQDTGPALLRRSDGTLQVRRMRPGGIDAAARTRFLSALSACANVRLAAKAAGFSHATFYHHKRRDPAFALEWRLALETGYTRLECALVAGWPDDAAPDHAVGDWRENDLPAIPPMSPSEALQLLYLHQKEARLWDTPTPLRRRRGESHEARDMRVELMWHARRQRQLERIEIAERERERRERGAAEPLPQGPPPPELPDLAQVTGWSKASGKPAHDANVALFGGWRIGG